jgi:hypothetical protein
VSSPTAQFFGKGVFIRQRLEPSSEEGPSWLCSVYYFEKDSYGSFIRVGRQSSRVSPPPLLVDGKSAVPEHGSVADDEIFALGVCQLSVVAMNALRPKEGFSPGVSGVILRCICNLVLEKPRPTTREEGDHGDAARSLACAGRSTFCRNAGDYAKIGRCRTAKPRWAASASST